MTEALPLVEFPVNNPQSACSCSRTLKHIANILLSETLASRMRCKSDSRINQARSCSTMDFVSHQKSQGNYSLFSNTMQRVHAHKKIKRNEQGSLLEEESIFLIKSRYIPTSAVSIWLQRRLIQRRLSISLWFLRFIFFFGKLFNSLVLKVDISNEFAL